MHELNILTHEWSQTPWSVAEFETQMRLDGSFVNNFIRKLKSMKPDFEKHLWNKSVF